MRMAPCSHTNLKPLITIFDGAMTSVYTWSWTRLLPRAQERSVEAMVDRAHGQDMQPAEYALVRRERP